MRQAMRIADPTETREPMRCGVCGCADLRIDEVLDQGVLQLAECPRCDHRSTRRGELPVRALRARGSEPDVASAA